MKTTTDRQLATTPEKGGRGQRTPLEIEMAIRRYALEEQATPTQIHRLLKANEKILKGHKLPDLRTVQRIHRKAVPPDTSGTWGLADAADPDAAAAILPVLAAVIERMAGRVPHLTKAQAKWVLRIRRVAPDLSPWWAFRLAVSYRVREDRKEPTADLDELLAFAPWRGQEHFDHFFSVIKVVHPNWIQLTSHEPPENASLEEMRAALGKLRIAEGVWLAMEMRKGVDDEQQTR